MATTTQEWGPPAAGAKFNMRTGTTPATTELNAIATPVAGAVAESHIWNPANPLFWVLAIVATTCGLAAVSTTVRVGPASGSVSVGKK